jgi:hypothetical protein
MIPLGELFRNVIVRRHAWWSDNSDFHGGATAAQELWLAGSCEAVALIGGPRRGGRRRCRQLGA